MATFFGEIVESSSRAFLDDDDEEFDDNATSNVSRKCECAASWTGDKPSTAGQTFIIIEGFAVEAFAKQYLLGGADLIGSIEVTEENDRKRKIGQISDLINNAVEVLTLTSLSLSQYRMMTWCQRAQLKACLLVYYTEVETCGLLDSRTMAPLMSLLSCEPLCKLPATSGSPPKPVPISHEIAGNLYL
ncbi:hypothetical protein B566_EDAN012613 [Ephemera danica]|nr:hypothetical protein B566_EDAN012613 [Ephemera danica]